ncbi:Ca2+-transporting ATPase [Liquorilactobacillus sucicola DSM 21376 = JCM 15457]|uniref:P-type Ca(2+) transporter n=1 Tax=Liquorilactobacillus sucicola DSM 21376 = JCM 15457 TaxID=1423806 RepID=A0A0R2DVX0_9LACO|nr:calcium-translocating P-type ATPase, PMCA-type [Liquorilactobacillus sucicola]KRN07606.1 Ca2+-transporting ATPase [Liquorilactobacillus sucicola DSM 21376 = JCM 15457]
MTQNYHQLSSDKVLTELNTTEQGLKNEEISSRLSKYGHNVLTEQKSSTLLQKFISQFKDLMIIILMIAAVIAFFAGDASDAIIIFLVVVLNAAFGVFQEAKAENAINALKEMTTPSSHVRRDGQIQTIKSSELVPGDIVLLEAGDIIPADLRFIKTNSLKVEEAALTGESVPVDKNDSPLEAEKLPLGDRHNLGYMNTNVTYGTAEGVVTATGMQTEVGHIANMLNTVDKSITPLQKSIIHLSKILSVLVLIIAALVFVIGIVADRASILDMLLTSISLAVAAIPEGLPAIVTITLALGTQAMAKRNALIRKLPAVETLGTTEIIASDKTGTLTQNKMTVEKIYQNDRLQDAHTSNFELQNRLAQIMILANDSQESDQGLVGDPTETALIQYYLDNKQPVNEVMQNFPRIMSLPFDSERKLMSVVVSHNEQQLVMTKGAVDELLKRTTKIEEDGQVRSLTDKDSKRILEINHSLAQQALRVLAFAYAPTQSIDASTNYDSTEIENNLIFVGMVGMIDPERPEAKAAVAEARSAGIRPLMITGDHKDTATAIAKRLQIIDENEVEGSVITGNELDHLSTEQLDANVEQYSVYARVAPEHKVRIVKAWQKKGKIVAMTGDGVNDAPALKTADIGVGMGITGTEVSKNASDIVLADDNFATIIVAVKEGRKVFANIQKAIQYLLSANLGEVLTLFFMTMLGWDIFAPAQILWINLVTDTFPAIALGVEKAEANMMQNKPRGNKSSFFGDGVMSSILYQGLLEGALTLGVYLVALTFPFHNTHALIHADALTMAFATLGLIQLFHAFNSKSIHGSIFRKDLFNNRMFNWSILLSGILLFATIFVSAFNDTFKVTPLAPQQWFVVLIGGLLMLVIVEIVKFFQRILLKK